MQIGAQALLVPWLIMRTETSPLERRIRSHGNRKQRLPPFGNATDGVVGVARPLIPTRRFPCENAPTFCGTCFCGDGHGQGGAPRVPFSGETFPRPARNTLHMAMIRPTLSPPGAMTIPRPPPVDYQLKFTRRVQPAVTEYGYRVLLLGT